MGAVLIGQVAALGQLGSRPTVQVAAARQVMAAVSALPIDPGSTPSRAAEGAAAQALTDLVVCAAAGAAVKGLEGGEVALYDDLGQMVALKRDGIRVVSPSKVVIDAPEIALGAEDGPAVARVGDPVVNNKIAQGSTMVTAA